MILRAQIPSPPPENRRTDRFGLPIFSLVFETEEQTRLRVAAIEKLVEDVFETVVRHLGKTQAKTLFEDCARRKRGNQGGSKSPDQDRLLLEEYDAAQRTSTPASKSQIAREFYKRHRGQSVGAIERKLGRLLKARAAREAAASAEHRKFCEAHKAQFGEYPNSILSDSK